MAQATSSMIIDELFAWLFSGVDWGLCSLTGTCRETHEDTNLLVSHPSLHQNGDHGGFGFGFGNGNLLCLF